MPRRSDRRWRRTQGEERLCEVEGGGGRAQALGSRRGRRTIDESKSGSTDSKTGRVVLSFYSKITWSEMSPTFLYFRTEGVSIYRSIPSGKWNGMRWWDGNRRPPLLPPRADRWP